MILRIQAVEVIGPQQLRLVFNNGVVKAVDTRSLLNGPVFAPLYDVDYFSTVQVDALCGTVVWPNGADFAPEALHALPTLPASVVSSKT